MSDLEQRIKEAAEKATRYTTVKISGMRGQYTIDIPASLKPEQLAAEVDEVDGYTVTGPLRDYLQLVNPANILALLAEKDAEIERLKIGVKGLQEAHYERLGHRPERKNK